MNIVRRHRMRRLGGWLALVAMLAQVFFSTVHVAAVAATLSGPLTLKEAPEAGLGLRVICTANGLIQVLPDEVDPTSETDAPTTINQQCPVCASAATALFAVPSEPLSLAPACSKTTVTHQQVISLINRQTRRLDVIRSPPSYLF